MALVGKVPLGGPHGEDPWGLRAKAELTVTHISCWQESRDTNLPPTCWAWGELKENQLNILVLAPVQCVITLVAPGPQCHFPGCLSRHPQAALSNFSILKWGH